MSESTKPLDLDDARSDIENSMTAEDRQTSMQLRNGQRAMNALIAELEGYRARATEDAAAKAERLKQAKELIAKVRHGLLSPGDGPAHTRSRSEAWECVAELSVLLGVSGG